MAPAEADGFQIGSLINLRGYTSTSKQFETALTFAMEGCEDQSVPVVFEILFLKTTGFFELTSEYSAYPEEQEVLV